MEKRAERGSNFAVFLAIFLMSTCFPESSGIHFSSKTYVILLTHQTPKGPIGEIQIANKRSDVVYSLSGVKNIAHIAIDKTTGRLTNLNTLNNEPERTRKFQYMIRAGTNDKSEYATTNLIIFRLREYYGDQYVDEMTDKVKSASATSTENLNDKHETSSRLFRLLRKLPTLARKHSEVRVDEVIGLVKRQIKQKFELQFGNNAVVYAFLRLKHLFSYKLLKEIESVSSCKQNVEIKCPTYSEGEYRNIDGRCNNLDNSHWGTPNTGFIRLLPVRYFDADGLNDPIGYPDQPDAPKLPSPFKISNNFIKEAVGSSDDSKILTHAVMQFGQFLDHDITLVGDSKMHELCINRSCSTIPLEDPCYPIRAVLGLPNKCLSVIRSAGICHKDPMEARQQLNTNTAYIDLSQVYASSENVSNSLRETGPDEGLLKVSRENHGDMLPLNTMSNSCIDGCFLAGDTRANEQQALTCFQTLFLREHNRIAKRLKSINGHWVGENVYQETRKILGAVFQKIVYYDYLPLIVGPNSLPAYTDYKPDINAGISNAFATAAFRFGHSTIRSEFELLNKGFNRIAPAINLRHMFFNNSVIKERGIEPFLLGLVGNFSDKVDRTFASGILKHLFEREGSPGQNLIAINIQRSRDHGLPGYNKFRELVGLSNAMTFEDANNEITDPENRRILDNLYNRDTTFAELWVAGLAENPVGGGAVGASFGWVITEQFTRARDGDRFYFEKPGVFTKLQLQEIKNGSLSRIYCDNLQDIVSIQKNAFKSPTENEDRVSCERIPKIDLCLWKDCGNGYIKKSVKPGINCKCTCKEGWTGSKCDVKKKSKPNEVEFDAEWPWL